MIRLGPNTLDALTEDVIRPAYVRENLGVGIVHLGLGAFHRAHEALYTDDALARDLGDWLITGVSLRNPTVRDALSPQDGLYILNERGTGGESLRVIAAIKDVLVAPESLTEVLARMVDPRVRIVSLTVTEKGYLRDPATGRLLMDHEDVRHDLTHPQSPRTAIGFIVEALRQRRQNGTQPFTVMSCDNLPANGKACRQVVVEFAKALDDAFGAWIEEHVAFPSTMVDRIVPAVTPEDVMRIQQSINAEDQGCVVAEPFRQWVIEDDFPAGRPAWESVGAQLVEDVEPYEDMKLRLLNAAHSGLAYLGYLGGYETVDAAMDNLDYVVFSRALMEEARPTLRVPQSVDVDAYLGSLIERFSNPNLKHRTWQIAMDGSQKLPQRLMATARERLAKGLDIQALALAVAGWMRYVAGTDEDGLPIEVCDPLAERLRLLAGEASGQPDEMVRKLLSVEEIFGSDLPKDARFTDAVTAHLRALYAKGAQQTVRAFAHP